MISIRNWHDRLLCDDEGAVIVEFALLGPLFIGLLLAVLQIGIGMQSYNAVRNVATDVSRDVMIEYLTSNEMNSAQIKQAALATSVSAPYLLDGDSIDVEVIEATTQRVDGAREFSFTIKYEIPSILNMMGFQAPTIEHSRPIFVVKSDTGASPSDATT